MHPVMEKHHVTAVDINFLCQSTLGHSDVLESSALLTSDFIPACWEFILCSVHFIMMRSSVRRYYLVTFTLFNRPFGKEYPASQFT